MEVSEELVLLMAKEARDMVTSEKHSREVAIAKIMALHGFEPSFIKTNQKLRERIGSAYADIVRDDLLARGTLTPETLEQQRTQRVTHESLRTLPRSAPVAVRVESSEPSVRVNGLAAYALPQARDEVILDEAEMIRDSVFEHMHKK